MRSDELTEWLDERLRDADMEDDLRAYVFQVLDSFGRAEGKDLSNESVVLVYASAVQQGDFVRFQEVGDWCLWASSYVPMGLAEPELVEEIGMKSYDACDRIMLRKWPVFARLASGLPTIVSEIRRHVFR